MKRIEVDEFGRATVNCLKCGRLLFIHSGKTSIYHEVKCPSCKKLTRYYPDTQMAELREIPPRQSSSGVRFY